MFMRDLVLAKIEEEFTVKEEKQEVDLSGLQEEIKLLKAQVNLFYLVTQSEKQLDREKQEKKELVEKLEARDKPKKKKGIFYV